MYTGMRDLSGRVKLLSSWTMVTVAPPCKYSLKWVNFIIYKIYLSKDAFKVLQRESKVIVLLSCCYKGAAILLEKKKRQEPKFKKSPPPLHRLLLPQPQGFPFFFLKVGL